MESSTVAELQKLLTGDLSSAHVVYRTPHHVLDQESRGVELVVRATAMTRVLYSLLGGNISGADAQRWASFVRVGYTAGVKGPVRALMIDYEETHEDAIAEAISRLDEIGDLIDGTIEGPEIADLIDALHAKS